MLTYNRSALRIAAVVSLLAIALAVVAVPAQAGSGSSNIVISQVYGAGGNSGATLKNDYIELFNRGTAAVDLSGWSVQYASTQGSSWTNKTNLSGVIEPGHYFLIQEAGGTNGTALPTPDLTGGISMAAGAGKVALVANQTPLAGTCPTGVVDFVGYGTGTNCYEGTTGPTATINTTNAAFRKGDGCTDTDDNAADFTVKAASPRNSASPANPCNISAPTNPVITSAVASPANALVGTTITFTASVALGTNPTSTGLTVTVDLSAIGGSATQPMYDDGTHGDVIAGDNNFTVQATTAGASAGTYTLPVTVKDDRQRSGTGNISLKLTVPAEYKAIHAIQGSGNTSPLNGQTVQTSGIVTAVASNGFYVQAPDTEQDSDPATSEGIFVYSGSAPTVAVGDAVQVTGTVSEYKPSGSVLSTTELVSPAVTVTSTGNPLPSWVEINPDPNGPIDQLERYEGMRVHVSNPRAIGPTGGTTTSDGIFYVVASPTARPLREPGVEPGIALPAGMPANYPKFDGNPERLRVDTSSCPAPTIAGVGQSFTELLGPLTYSTDFTIVACPGAPIGTIAAQAVPIRGEREFTVASFNMLNFINDANRMAKASMAIRNIMRMPDIIGVEEMYNLATLQALADKVNTDAGSANPGYVAQLLSKSSGQQVGFLYRGDRVKDVTVVEVGADATFTDPRYGTQAKTNDRAPLVMTAKLVPPVGQPLPVTVIVNHLRSLIDVDTVSGTGDFARAKRQAGAEYLASLIAGHQAAGENVISVGDYNAFEFNDGYVDVLGTITGHPTGADQVLLASQDLVDPDLIDLAMTLAADRRYSYVEYGNAQTLDHIVVTGSLLTRQYHLEIAHNNADFPKTLSSDATRPERVSDHDMPVAYFTFPPPQADLATSITADNLTVLSGGVHTYTITVKNNGPDAADTVTMIQALPDHAGFQSVSAPAGWNCAAPAIGGTGKVSCIADSLASGDTAQFTVTVRINCATADGVSLISAAGATSHTLDPQSANDNALVSTAVSNPAPVINGFAADKLSLGPPNHKLVPVTLSYAMSDNCDTSMTPVITISSNQPANGTGDGNTAADWQVVDAHHVLLRAERAPDSANGRIYTIKVSTADSMGYSTSQSLQISVPR